MPLSVTYLGASSRCEQGDSGRNRACGLCQVLGDVVCGVLLHRRKSTELLHTCLCAVLLHSRLFTCLTPRFLLLYTLPYAPPFGRVGDTEYGAWESVDMGYGRGLWTWSHI